MKKLFSLSMLAFTLLFATSCGPTTDEAIAYNDKIIDEQVAIIDKINTLEKSMETWENHSGMDQAYVATVKQLEESTAVVSAMEDFDGSSEFKDGALKLFGIYKAVLEKEYKEMIALYKLPDDQFSSEVEDKWAGIHDQAFKKMDDGLNELRTIQEKFSEKYKFEIEKTNL